MRQPGGGAPGLAPVAALITGLLAVLAPPPGPAPHFSTPASHQAAPQQRGQRLAGGPAAAGSPAVAALMSLFTPIGVGKSVGKSVDWSPGGLRATWADLAFEWALGCCSRHFARRSLQVRTQGWG